jgi:DNA-binding CsgD family transcriptional regulator
MSPKSGWGYVRSSWGCRATDPRAEALLPYVAGVALETARRLLDESDATAPAPRLSASQRDRLVQVARGKSDWEAAAILGLRPDTVHWRIEEAKRRFKVPTRLQLVIRALAHCAISLADVYRGRFRPSGLEGEPGSRSTHPLFWGVGGRRCGAQVGAVGDGCGGPTALRSRLAFWA